MGNVCHNLCERFKLRPKSLGEKKRCSVCCVNFRTNEIRCLCCGVILRVKVRYKSKTGPRTSWPELDRNRKENHRKLEELLRAKGKANADKIAAVLVNALFMSSRRISIHTGIAPGVVLYTIKKYPERFGSVLPPPGHKQERRIWLKTRTVQLPICSITVAA